jgi:hypothetical protein
MEYPVQLQCRTSLPTAKKMPLVPLVHFIFNGLFLLQHHTFSMHLSLTSHKCAPPLLAVQLVPEKKHFQEEELSWVGILLPVEVWGFNGSSFTTT